EAALHLGVARMTRDEVVNEVQGRHRAGDLGRVDVAVDPKRWFLRVWTGGCVAEHRQPDVAALEAASDRLYAHELRMRCCKLTQPSRQLIVTVVRVETNVGHR